MIETLYPFLVVLHVLSAITWVGGVLFMAFAAIPATRNLEPTLRRDVIRAVGESFRPVGWLALGLLVVTGTFFLWRWGARWETLLDFSFFSAPHTRLLGYKLVLVTVMLVISGIHDWVLGPRASTFTVGSPEAETMRKVASYMGRATGILVLLIVVLAVFIARPWLTA